MRERSFLRKGKDKENPSSKKGGKKMGSAYCSFAMNYSKTPLTDEYLEVMKVVMNESKKIADRIEAAVYVEFGNICDYPDWWSWNFELAIDLELKLFGYVFRWPLRVGETPPPKKPVFFAAGVHYLKAEGRYTVPHLYIHGLNLGVWPIPRKIWKVLRARFPRENFGLYEIHEKELWDNALAYAAALIDIIHQKNLECFSMISELIADKRETIIKDILEDLGIEEKLWLESLDK